MAYIILDKQALAHNLQLIAQKAGGKEKIAAVLKDNAYGHGLKIFATLLKEWGVTKAVVRTIAEAMVIQNIFEDIIVLADIPDRLYPFSFAVNDLEALEHFPPKSMIELKIDTGMHRNGIAIEQIEEAIGRIVGKGLRLRGAFTHFRSADVLGSELFWQELNWQEAKGRIERACRSYTIARPRLHSQNSAALFRQGPKDDFARVGIAMYGYLEMDRVFEQPPLEPVLSLWAKRLSKRRLKKGERVGYGGVFEATKDMVVSTYDVGYGDGIFRSQRYTKDKEILGRVSMDSIVVEGDEKEICVFDDAKELAHSLGTISYEVLVKLNPSIARFVR